jgi:hypothetical protein
MFIHWSIYLVPAHSTGRKGNRDVAEWCFSNKSMQVKDYQKFAPQLNATRVNARESVQIAKDSGMK